MRTPLGLLVSEARRKCAAAERAEVAHERARVLATICRECGTALDPRGLARIAERPGDFRDGILGACCIGSPEPEHEALP